MPQPPRSYGTIPFDAITEMIREGLLNKTVFVVDAGDHRLPWLKLTPIINLTEIDNHLSAWPYTVYTSSFPQISCVFIYSIVPMPPRGVKSQSPRSSNVATDGRVRRGVFGSELADL
jgi:hypothetical protein